MRGLINRLGRYLRVCLLALRLWRCGASWRMAWATARNRGYTFKLLVGEALPASSNTFAIKLTPKVRALLQYWKSPHTASPETREVVREHMRRQKEMKHGNQSTS